MAWYACGCLNTLLAEINASAPNRNKASDGSIGDQAHQSRTSDHNPCSCHSAVCARDFTHDPAGGFDSYAFADWLRQRCQQGVEQRVKYIISNSRIASFTKDNWSWRSYTGSNPHSRHAHVSVLHGPESFDNKQGWGWSGTPVEPPATGVEQFNLNVTKTELTPENRSATKGMSDVFLIQYISAGMFKQTGNADLDVGKPDGDYGPRTQQAVTVLQALNKLEQDACCGPQTWAAVLNADGV